MKRSIEPLPAGVAFIALAVCAISNGAEPDRGGPAVARHGLPHLRGLLDAASSPVADADAGRQVVRIAFLGGSITGGSWRGGVINWLRERFPQVTFEEIAAAVGGTGSDYGAHRLRTDVLRHLPDVVFVEFAVNDAQSGLRERAVATTEAIVRNVRDSCRADVLFVYFPMESQLAGFSEGDIPPVVGFHEQVAARHQLPSIVLGFDVAARVAAGTLAWRGRDGSTPPAFTSDGVHPGADGNQLAAAIVGDALEEILDRSAGIDAAPKEVTPLVPDNPWMRANLARPEDATLLQSAWITETVKAGWPRSVLKTTTSGKPLRLSFTGGGDVRVKFLRARAGGRLAVRVDDQPTITIDTRGDRDGTEDWLPLDSLPEGRHVITMALDGGEPAAERAPAVRVREVRFFGRLEEFGP